MCLTFSMGFTTLLHAEPFGVLFETNWNGTAATAFIEVIYQMFIGQCKLRPHFFLVE